MIQPASGTLLIANPHLDDPNFLRTVVFLCEHNEEGSFGFVINRKTGHSLEDLVPELEGFALPVYEGGPVELNTLHFLHQYPQITGCKEVVPGVYWGGDFEQLITSMISGVIQKEKIRFYLGYSGWSQGQLDIEMEEKTWIVGNANKHFLFADDENALWKEVLKSMGGEYELIINAPIDPQLN